MSRCLPFPPPGYVWNGVNGEALSELIKVQRERVKAERERKEKKKRKKEKKKEREQEKILQKSRGHHKRHKALRSNKGDEETSENQGKIEHEILAMERSSLTDELEQPVSDSLYESSDNSQSIKKKRNQGTNIFQIDFQFQKHKTLETTSSNQDKLELSLEEQFFSDRRLPASDDVQELIPTNSPQRARINMDKKSEMALTESLYKELVVNWIPPPLQKHLDAGDQEWLFQTKQDTRDTSSSTANYDVSHQGNFTQYPHAQNLPEVNIYALPYTIPY